ncbi:hypothetical protein HZB90_00305, partial [archaeon]|nr:hypothetical protein [archaeon]
QKAKDTPGNDASVEEKHYSRLRAYLHPDCKLSPADAADYNKCYQLFSSCMFFGGMNPPQPCYILFQDTDGKISLINDQGVFVNKMIQLAIFIKDKEQSFDRMMNSVVEPFFMGMWERLSFLDYNKARETSKQIMYTMLKHQEAQGDITPKDHAQIKDYMEHGYEELKIAPENIAEEIKRAHGKSVMYENFVKKPHLVHQLMTDVLKLAIFAEARARLNVEGQLIYTGRDTGYEGANTVAVHGFNNYLKYKMLLLTIGAGLPKKYIDAFDHFESFKMWLVMGTHDAAAYDRHNSLGYTAMTEYGNANKKAHTIIGANIFHENRIIRLLFGVDDPEDIDPKREQKRNFELLASIIQNHDYTRIHFDIANLGITDPHVIKKLISFTISGIADNSAGIGFSEDGHTFHVDPWEEKGSAIFLVPDKAPPGQIIATTDKGQIILGGDQRPMTSMSNDPICSMSNPQILWHILKRLAQFGGSDLEKAYKRKMVEAEKKKNPAKEITEKDVKISYFPGWLWYTEGGTDEGKREWMLIHQRVVANVLTMPESTFKSKLLRGVQEREFSYQAALTTAGVLNAGYMRADNYDFGTGTLTLSIVMSKKWNDILKGIMGDMVYGRIAGFLKEYENQFVGISGKPKPEYFMDHNVCEVYNSVLDTKTGKFELGKTIGLRLKIDESESFDLLSSDILEDASKQLLAAAEGAAKKEISINTEELPKAA